MYSESLNFGVASNYRYEVVSTRYLLEVGEHFDRAADAEDDNDFIRAAQHRSAVLIQYQTALRNSRLETSKSSLYPMFCID